MDTLAHARDYLARGWSIIPLADGSKRPPSGFPLAAFLAGERRFDAAAVASWWGPLAKMKCGIGIVTGKPAGLGVIDVDPRNGGDIHQTCRDVPTHLVAQTGGGGVHLFCAYPAGGEVRCSGSKRPLRPGVDRKADGGYVVAAPSIHPDGDPYAWLRDDGGPAPLPAWCLEAPEPPGQDPDGIGEQWVARYLGDPQQVSPGLQEDTLTRLCWWAARHLPQDIALGLLTNWVRQLPLGNAHDPWHASHVADRLDRAYQKIAAEPKAFDVVLEGSSDPKSPPSDTITPLSDLVRTAQAVVETEQAHEDWLIPDLLAPGVYTEVIGAMKEGKTTFMLAMVKALVTGDTFLNRNVHSTSVLFVTEQSGASLRSSLERAHLEDATDLHILTIGDLWGLEWKDAALEIVALAEQLECGLIIIDTLARLAMLEDEDKAGSVSSLYPFAAAKAKRIGVLFLRHSRKSGGAINVVGRGSGAITGEMDIVAYMTAPDGVATDYRNLEWISRLSEAGELHLNYEDGGFTLADAAPKAVRARGRRDDRHAPLIGALAGHVTGLTCSDLQKQLDMVHSTCYRRLQELVDEGRVRREDDLFILQPTKVTVVE